MRARTSSPTWTRTKHVMPKLQANTLKVREPTNYSTLFWKLPFSNLHARHAKRRPSPCAGTSSISPRRGSCDATAIFRGANFPRTRVWFLVCAWPFWWGEAHWTKLRFNISGAYRALQCVFLLEPAFGQGTQSLGLCELVFLQCKLPEKDNTQVSRYTRFTMRPKGPSFPRPSDRASAGLMRISLQDVGWRSCTMSSASFCVCGRTQCLQGYSLRGFRRDLQSLGSYSPVMSLSLIQLESVRPHKY